LEWSATLGRDKLEKDTDLTEESWQRIGAKTTMKAPPLHTATYATPFTATNDSYNVH